MRSESVAGNVHRLAGILAAMGSEARLRIMQLLLGAHPHGMVVNDLQRRLGIPASTLSHHLEKLKSRNLVRVRREHTCLRYTANSQSAAGEDSLVPEDQLRRLHSRPGMPQLLQEQRLSLERGAGRPGGRKSLQLRAGLRRLQADLPFRGDQPPIPGRSAPNHASTDFRVLSRSGEAGTSSGQPWPALKSPRREEK